eukprot:EG_transcript_38323
MSSAAPQSHAPEEMGAAELAELQRALEGIDFRDVEAVEIDSKTTVRRELHVLPRTACVDPAATPLTAHEWVPSLGPLLDREDAAPETRSVFVKLHLAMTGRRWGVETFRPALCTQRGAAPQMGGHSRDMR